MAGLPGVKVGPLDPDATAEFGTVDAANNARILIRRHSRQMPPQLRNALLRPFNEPRSLALDDDEVAEYVEDSDVLPDEATYVPGSANVRGDESDRKPLILAFVYETKGQRTGKAVLPYGLKEMDLDDDDDDPLSASREKGDRLVGLANARRQGLGASTEVAQILAEALQGVRPAGDGASSAEADEALAEQVRQLSEQVEGLREQAEGQDEKLREEAEALRAEVEALRAERENPEPFEGFKDASVERIEEVIDETDDLAVREVLKRDIRAAEEASVERGERDKPRQGVVKATEPVELAPADG